jgi:hypothetical protein
MQQAYDLNLNLNLVPVREIPERVQLDLPESARKSLIEANAAVMAWLAADDKNRSAFIIDPLGSLQRAGVEIDRASLKALARVRESAGTAEAVVPGLQLRSVTAKVRKSGKVRSVDTVTDWAPPALKNDGDCGCDKKGGK